MTVTKVEILAGEFGSKLRRELDTPGEAMNALGKALIYVLANAEPDDREMLIAQIINHDWHKDANDLAEKLRKFYGEDD